MSTLNYTINHSKNACVSGKPYNLFYKHKNIPYGDVKNDFVCAAMLG